MSIYEDDAETVSADKEAYYERVASREEVYLEETEEEVREALASGDSSPSQNSANTDSRSAGSLDEQLYQAAEELITGDSDDPPLSEEMIAEILKPN